VIVVRLLVGTMLGFLIVFSIFTGLTLIAFGAVLCLTVIGLPLGLPMVALGLRLLWVG
jgi:hypothetical protein